ncbi:undecaprenyl-diphosphate phosphatase [Elusimicrobiota bacterium]
MSEYINIAILAIVQGLTEFLPVSSSGHLVVLQNWINTENSNLTVTVFMHLGTLFSVMYIFRSDLVTLLKDFAGSLGKGKLKRGKMVWLIIAANIPAGIAGIFLKDSIEAVFTDTKWTLIFLTVTAFFLLLSRFIKKKELDFSQITLLYAILIGISQMFAILPGISRSGITIVTAMLLGIKSESAAKFSFFIMLPAVGGAFLLELFSTGISGAGLLPLLLGVAVSFSSGCLAIKLLYSSLNKDRLYLFSYYLFIIVTAATAVMIIQS